MSPASAGVLGVDIGGTFTDLAFVDSAGDRVYFDKVLTTPAEPERAVLEGIARVLATAGSVATDLSYIVHGTTLATNTIIERTGARVGLLTTRGFRDVIEMRRERRYDPFDLAIELPVPLVPRRLRREVSERIGNDGGVIAPLDRDELLSAVESLVDEGIDALALSFLFSPRNPAHELEARDLIAERFPELPVSVSSAVSPQLGEFERISTTVVNAYIQPPVSRYLSRLEQQLRSAVGYENRLYVMLSSGGVATAEYAQQFPVRFIESGPAGGAMAAARLARAMHRERLLAFDMGGTTAKICAVNDFRPSTNPEFEVARVRWYQRGSGLPVRVPFIDMIEIGTGGGSIARIDEMQLLKVGPQSAGAVPGPACYGLGGELPTVTDADLVLGYLDPGRFLGGELQLEASRAARAIETLGRVYGMDATTCAWAIHSLANEEMAKAARLHMLQRGHDPAGFTMSAFGGAGPVHAYHLAILLGISEIVYPVGAGVESAYGFVTSPLSVDLVRGYDRRIDNGVSTDIVTVLEELREQAERELARAGLIGDQIRYEHFAGMSYETQRDEIEIEFGFDQGADADGLFDDLDRRFRARYRELFGATINGLGVRVSTWRLRASSTQLHGDTAIPAGRDNARSGLTPTRQIYLPEADGWTEAAVYERADLEPQLSFDGPAIVHERESTVVIGTAGRACVDEAGNLVVKIHRRDG